MITEIALIQSFFKKKENQYKESAYEILDEQLNLLKKLRLKKLKNTHLVVFHSEWLVPPRGNPIRLDEIYPIPNFIIDKITQQAKDLNIFIAFRIWEKGEKNKCQFKGLNSNYNIYDTAVLIDPMGNIFKYRRSHFVRGYSRGNNIDIIHTPIGNIGLLICDEILSPEIIRILCVKGAQIIVLFHGLRRSLGVPKFIFNMIMDKKLSKTTFLDKKSEITESIYWSATPDIRKIAYTRSYENYCCIVGSNSVGNSYAGGKYKSKVGGESFIALPRQEVIIGSSTREQVLITKVDVDFIKTMQSSVLKERQPSFYQELIKENNETALSISDLVEISDHHVLSQ